MPLTILFMVIVGLGIGPFFSVPMVATQNSLEPTRIGIGTSVLGYLSQMGAVLGATLVGVVMNQAQASGASQADAYHLGFLTVAVLAAAAGRCGADLEDDTKSVN